MPMHTHIQWQMISFFLLLRTVSLRHNRVFGFAKLHYYDHSLGVATAKTDGSSRGLTSAQDDIWFLSFQIVSYLKP